jgi:type IV secretory pathway VirB10-like protein
METFDNIRKILRGERPDFPTVEEATPEIPQAPARPAKSLYLLVGAMVLAILAACGLTVWWYSGDHLKATMAARRGPSTLNPGATADFSTEQNERGQRDRRALERTNGIPPPTNTLDIHVTSPDDDPYTQGTGRMRETPEQRAAERDQNVPPPTKGQAKGVSGSGSSGPITRPTQQAAARPVHFDYSQLFDEQGHVKPKTTVPAGDGEKGTSAEVAHHAPGVGSAPVLPTALDLTKSGPPMVAAPTKNPLESMDSSTGHFYRFIEGDELECVLRNRVTSNGMVVGPVKVQVSRDYYSLDHQHLIIPQGTVVMGTVQPVGSGEQERLFLTFHRLIMWDGYTVDLDQFTGLSVMGEMGLRDQVNHHYVEKIGYSVVLAGVGAVSNLGVGGYGSYGGVSFGASLRSNVGSQLGQEAMQILNQKLNRIPTFTLRESLPMQLYVTSDLWVPDVDHHTMGGSS